MGRERFDAVVHLISSVLIAIVPHEAEFRLDHTGLHIGDADRRAHQLFHERFGERAHGKLGRTVLR